MYKLDLQKYLLFYNIYLLKLVDTVYVYNQTRSNPRSEMCKIDQYQEFVLHRK